LIRVEIIADRSGTADDIASLLALEDRIEVVGAGPVDTVPHLTTAAVDVLLAVNLASAQLPHMEMPTVLLSEGPRSWEPGIHAWLPLTCPPQAITAAIIGAAAGLYTLTADQLHLSAPDDLDQMQAERLTPRELQVLALMSDGLGNKQIAAHLNISDHTAKFHVGQVLAKLGAGSRTEAVRTGIRRGLVAL
jgi:DNA-binding CsgD family transcriptional regulator